MREWGKSIAADGLTLRTSPRDGDEIAVLKRDQDKLFEILSKETWMRVKLESGEVGFVLADYVELQEQLLTDKDDAPAQIREYTPQRTGVFVGRSIRCDEAFFPALKNLENIAADNVRILIVSSFREPYAPVSGAVVDPADFSNHHIGHAIDFNLIVAQKTYRSADLRKLIPRNENEGLAIDSGLPIEVTRFLREVESTGLRWGGRFRTPDPTHIDDGLNMADRSTYEKKFAGLWGEAALGGPDPVRRRQVG